MSLSSADKPTCIFAGAGCSKALFKIPVQKDLISDFLTWNENRGEQHLSSELRRLLHAVKDIELVLSHYHNMAYPEPSGRNGRYIRELMFLRVALAQFFDDQIQSNHQQQGSSCRMIKEFLNRSFLQPSNLIVVTTNFDLVMETLLEGIFGIGSYYYPGVSPYSENQGIPVFKLHGSINWMENRGKRDNRSFERAGDDVVLERPSSMALSRSPWDKSGFFFERDDLKYIPIVVPFLFQKYAWLSENNRQWKKIFDKLWSEAQVGIRNSRRVLFWGYSLPAADYHMFSFLYKSLVGSKGEYEIVEKLENEDDTNLIKLVRILVNDSPVFRKGLTQYLTTY